jgi:hypothetical protein
MYWRPYRSNKIHDEIRKHVGEQSRIVNRMKASLIRLGITMRPGEIESRNRHGKNASPCLTLKAPYFMWSMSHRPI